MDRKITRMAFLTIALGIMILIGGVFITRIVAKDFSRTDCPNSDLGFDSVQSCTCLGQTYSDTIDPEIHLRNPGNNSILLIGGLITIEVTDNFPMNDFLAEEVFYNWDGQTNSTLIQPIGPFNITIPNDEGIHILHVYARDIENNWTYAKFSFTSTTNTDLVSTIKVTTTTTTTTPRRSDGFIIVPIILGLICSVPIISWKRNSKRQ